MFEFMYFMHCYKVKHVWTAYFQQPTPLDAANTGSALKKKEEFYRKLWLAVVGKFRQKDSIPPFFCLKLKPIIYYCDINPSNEV